MAITVDQATLGTGNASANTTTSMSTTNTVAAGAMIVLIVGRFFSGASTIAMNATGGLTWTQAHTAVSGNVRASLFYAFAPSGLASSTTLSVTHTNASDAIMGAASYLGADSSGTVTAFNGTGASTAAWSSGNVTGNSGDALIGGCFVDAGAVSSSTPGGSANERIDRNVAGQSETLVLQDILSIAGTTAMTGTWNAAGAHIAVAASFKAAAGGGGSVDLPILVTVPPIAA